MPERPGRYGGFVVSFCVGAAYIALTLPKGIYELGERHNWSMVARVGAGSLALNQWLAGVVPSFTDLMRHVLYALGLYLIGLLLLAFRHRRFAFFGWGGFTLCLSTAIFHVVAWLGFVVLQVMMLIAWIFGGIGALVAAMGGSVGRFLWRVGAATTHLMSSWTVQLLGDLWWIGAAVIVLLLIFLVASVGAATGSLAFTRTIKTAAVLAVAASAAYLLRLMWRFVGPFVLSIAGVLRSILAVLFRALLVVTVGLAAILAVATIGQLLIDQFRSALNAGSRRFGVIIGAMAIGTSLAILLLVSDVYGLVSWLPDGVSVFVTGYIHQPVPHLGALITLLILSISIASVVRNVYNLTTEPTSEQFGKSLVYSVIGIFLTGALVAVGTETER
jgi:hypothetical protein